ncbi:MAG: hypothetical protein IKL85_09290, partial [Lentisphaeria bacterium]|nr:hypothetical protein [Lentisphaeria bacterium]
MNTFRFALLPALAAAASLQAADVAVTEETKLVVTTGDRLVPAALCQGTASLPGTATPIFHLDATGRDGWEFSDDGGTLITKIPSLTGSRYLTTDKTGGSWTIANWPVSPVLIAADPSLGGRPCIDFGEVGSKRGLLFNAVADMTTGNIPSNTLNGIGTVFWVIDSRSGGGSLMGGGYGLNNGGMNSGNLWLRGLSAYSGNWDFGDPWSPLFRYYDGAVDDAGSRSAAKGVFYHDGIAASPMRLGMNGGWEIISLQPEEPGLTATGLGLGNVGRNSNGASSGAQRIAELIVYGEKLSDADRERVEAYLRKKWFGEDPRGWNDNAVVDFVRASKNVQETYLSNGAEIEVAPAAGETLNIGRLMGGRGGYASFNLKGEGTLSIGDATSYQGTIRIHKGRMSFDKRPVPSSLPAGTVAHFDASDASSYVTETDENGLARIVRWDSLSDFTYNGHRLCLARNPECPDQVPWLCENAMPGGRSAVDFGHKRLYGPHLLLYGTNSLSSAVSLAGISTVIAVMSPHSGASGLVGAYDGAAPAAANAFSYFNPSGHDRDWYSPIFSSAVLTKVNPKLSGASDNISYIDGIRHDHTSGYPHPAWQVVAFEGAGSKFAALGLTGNYYYAGGAMRQAEIAIYTRPLSERELKDASAYLSAKWLGRETPGYARTAARSRIDDVSVLESVGPAEIHVAEGTTLRVGTLVCDGSLRKTGAGVLEVMKTVNAAVNLKVEEGTVVRADAAAPENGCAPAAEPAAHFDASDESTLMFNPSDGLDREYVWTWYDKNARNSAYWRIATQSANQPWLNRIDTLNSLPVLDFGANSSYRYLHFAKPLDGVKAAFVVWGSQAGGGCLLGNVDVHGFENGKLNDFRRLDKATVDTL